jgi:hypothetical protein
LALLARSVIVGDVDGSSRRLTEQARAEIEMVAGPIVLQHDEFLAECGTHVLEARLQAPDRLLLTEPVGDGDDDGLRHARFQPLG